MSEETLKINVESPMSDRDEFAKAALAAILPPGNDKFYTPERAMGYAKAAYAVADAMEYIRILDTSSDAMVKE